MPLIFCDLNFIVTAHQGLDIYKDHLRQLVVNSAVTFVLSPMHWIEAAEDNDAGRRTAKADFMDSLNAGWLYERRTIQRKEVAAAFFRFLGIPVEPARMVGSASDVISELGGRPAKRDSRDFVTHLRSIGPDHPLEQSLRQAFEANQANGIKFRNGALTPALLQKVERLYIQQLLPAATPGGIVIDAHSKDGFLNAYQLADLPALALETRATHDNWREARQLNRNNFMDQQHLMALPYVDLFVTDDARLSALIARISVGLHFPIATPLTKAEFDRRYP